MSDNSHRRWVVLIQKKPRGPLTEVEIQTLLGKGLLRTNDLGFELDTATGKAKSDWKMLWQFPEFDRRAKADAERAAKGLPPSPWVEKRGPAPTPEKIKAQVNAALPEELLHITPEDLIPHSRAPKLDIQETDLRESVAREASEGGMQRFAFALLALVIFSGIGYHFMGGSSSSDERAPAAEAARQEVVTPSPSRPSRAQNRALPGGSRPAPTIRPAEPTARPDDNRNARGSSRDEREESDRDSGEISRDDRYDNEEEDEVKEDSAFENSRAPRKAKRLPRRDEEDEVESAREPAEEDIDNTSDNWE